MRSVEDKIKIVKNTSRNKRNSIRRFLLFLFFCLFVFFIFKIFNYAVSKKIEIKIYQSEFTNKKLLQGQMQNYLERKNFYLVSPKEIKKHLLLKFPILTNAVIRKYIFPEMILVVYVTERNVWGILKAFESGNLLYEKYIADDGVFINRSLLSDKIKRYSFINLVTFNVKLTGKDFKIVKKSIDFLSEKYKLKLSTININSSYDIEFICSNSMKIKAGKLDEDLIQRLVKIEPAIEVINKNAYTIDYLDLTLDSSILLKKPVFPSKK